MEVDHLLCINGHNERIWSVAWSPKEDIFVTSGSDCKVKIWKFLKTSGSCGINRCPLNNPGCATKYTYELEFEIDKAFKKTVRSVKFSSDGKYLICSSFDGTSSIWSKVSSPQNSQSNHSNNHWVCLATLEGHENEVKCASFDMSCRYVATCGRDKTVWIYEKTKENNNRDYQDLNKMEFGGNLDYFCSAILTGHTHDVKHVCWNPIGLLLASSSYDNTIRLWTFREKDWSCIQTINLHSNTVWCVSFSPDGSKLASCSSDKSLIVYRSKIVETFLSSSKITKPPLNRFSIFNTTFPVPSIQRECSISEYGPLVADDWEVWRAYEELHSRSIYCVDFGDLLLTGGGDNKVKVIDLEDDFSNVYEIKAHTSDVNGVSWKQNDSSKIFATVGDDEYIRMWRIS